MHITERTIHSAVKRTHRCSWCWQMINIGDQYSRYRSLDGSEAVTIKMHPECYEQMQIEAQQEGGYIEWIPGQERPKKQENGDVASVS